MEDLYPLVEYGIENYHYVLKMPIRFQDIDGMGHANNVAYFGLLETARLEYIIRITDLQDKIHEMSNMPVIMGGQSITYRSPAFYREFLLVGVRTNYIRRSSFGFEYEMREATSGRLVAEGGGTHIFYNYETQKSMPVPDDWIAKLEAYEGRNLRQTSGS